MPIERRIYFNGSNQPEEVNLFPDSGVHQVAKDFSGGVEKSVYVDSLDVKPGSNTVVEVYAINKKDHRPGGGYSDQAKRHGDIGSIGIQGTLTLAIMNENGRVGEMILEHRSVL